MALPVWLNSILSRYRHSAAEELIGGSDEQASDDGDYAVDAARWNSEVQEVIETLERLNFSTEGGFISIGAQLQAVFQTTLAISKNLSSGVEKFSGDGKGDAIDGLRHIIDLSSGYLDQFDSTSTQAIAHLKEVSTIIVGLPETIAGFGRIVSQLRIMGITTRIETARLGLEGMGFEHLADEVTALGEVISAKVKDVETSIKAIAGIVAANRQSLATLRDTNQALRKSVTQNMHSDLQLLNEKHEALVNVIQNITRQSDDAVTMLHTIVGAIQFHDITRQQIEHVIDALKNLAGEVSSGSDGIAAHTILACELQPIQLRRARSEFDNAVLSITSSFGSLANTINVMQAESKDVVGFGSGSGTTFFDILETSLKEVTGALLDGERTIRGFLDALEEIGAVVEKIKKYMEEMGDVGTEVELLALNSRVRSAKASERGAALGVIAEAIQQLSLAARTQIDGVVAAITSLVAVTDEMHLLASKSGSSRSGGASIEEMTSQLSDLIGMFHAGNAAGTELLRDTEKACSTMSYEMERMAATIRESRTTALEISAAEEVLAAIALEARSKVPEFVLSEVEQRLEEMKQRYTMETEHITHAAYLEGKTDGSSADFGSGTSSGGEIELF